MHANLRLWQRIAVAAVLVGFAAPAQAQKGWTGQLKGTNEVPPNASTATGLTNIFLSGHMLTVNVIWQGLVGGNPLAAHIHCCTSAQGTNIGVAVGLPIFPSLTSGTYTNTFDLTSTSVYAPNFLINFGSGTAAGAEAALISGLDAGRAYVNIHNAVYPGGEIRANVVSTPEPASMMLVATGLLAIAGLKRRKAA